jgi:regulatory protein
MADNKKKSALQKIVDYLSVRDHSEKEIRNKLTTKEYENDEIDEGLELAQEQGLMLNPKKLSENISEQLHRKYKGILYINQYLSTKGLPSVAANWELEVEKAKYLVLNRFSKNPPYTIEEKQDIYRYLTNRGFADQTIDKLIHAINAYEVVESSHEER